MKKIVVLLLLIWGCSGKNEVTPSADCFPAAIVKGTTRHLYRYDTQNRVIYHRYADIAFTTSYGETTLSGSEIIYQAGTDKVSLETPSTPFTIQKDSRGRITRMSRSLSGISYQNDIAYDGDFVSTITYQTNGKLIGYNKYIYTAGNLTQVVATDIKGFSDIWQYTYDTGLKNYARLAEYVLGDNSSEVGPQPFELGELLGASIKNLPVKVQHGTAINTITYEYAKSRPVKVTNSGRQAITLEYDCQ